MYDEYQDYNYVPVTPQAPPPRRRRRRAGGRVFVVVLCLLIAAASGFAGGYLANTIGSAPAAVEMPVPMLSPSAPEPPPPEVLPSAVVNTPEPENGDELLDGPETPELPAVTRTGVADMIRHSVVEIKTETISTGGWGFARGGTGAGSGVIISKDGYIVTNNHVISGVTNITVRLSDGREFPAELIAIDERTDLAVIRISAEGLIPAVFGSSSELMVGDGALAVGNPLGELGGTVTSGIISALDRDIVLDGQIMTLLQTDAAVNPGNSGGGLFNLGGELIGVVVAKSGGSSSGGMTIEGLGFAIPSNTAQSVISDLLEHGYVRGRVDLGLDLVDIQTAQALRAYRVSDVGVYILESSDERLMRGDRIIAVDDRGISSQLGLDAAMRGYGVGDTVSLEVIRGGQSVTVEMRLTEWRPSSAA